MKSYISNILIGAALLGMSGLTACVGDLDQLPKDPQTNDATKFQENPRQYIGEAMAKCYSGIAVSGQGGSGSSGISGLDNGTSNWSRIIFMLNEFTTDEVSWIWPDVGVVDLCTNTWGSSNGNIFGGYSHFYTHIAICNDFIRLSRNLGTYNVEVGGTGDKAISQEELDQFVREARALRDLSYYYVIDFWGNAVRAWDDMNYGDVPQQVTRKELFDLVVADLEDVLANFKESGVYGRVGRDGIEALLCRFYLNAEEWTGENMYQKCWDHASSIIARHQGGGFRNSGLANDYLALFCGNNDMFMPGGSLRDQNEILWGIPFQYPQTTSYGGTEFLIAAAVSGDEMPVIYGLNGQWKCMHALKQLSEKFTDNDERTFLWCKEDQGFSIDNTGFSTFTDGYAAIKFTNAKADASGVMPRHTQDFDIAGTTRPFNWAGVADDATTGLPSAINPFPDTDFPIIRLADVYLMAAECALRGSGSTADGLAYVNLVRGRAGLNDWSQGEYNLDNLLNERARELYWENVRRTDLIRFDKFVSGYNWSWKNNMANGGDIAEHMKLFPIPADVLATYGDSYKQNPGYSN